MAVEVKICGINRPEAAAAAVAGGARYLGLVFYPPSPRAVAPMVGAELARHVPTWVQVVGLFVNPSDEELEHVVSQVPLDYLQLHGGESANRVAAVKDRFRIPVIKALRVATEDDLAAVGPLQAVADKLLFDAKLPPNVATLPGGNGIPFDWRLLTGRSWTCPWLLSGGLTPDNLAEAVALTQARTVDVSSGVEDRPGHKNPALITRFLQIAAALPADATSSRPEPTG